MMTNDDSNSENSTEEYDMLDDIYGSSPLFRIMPQPADSFHSHDNDGQRYQPIIGYGDDSDRILREHTTFSIDWFTDNKDEAPLRVISSKNLNGINGLIEDESVFKSINGGLLTGIILFSLSLNEFIFSLRRSRTESSTMSSIIY